MIKKWILINFAAIFFINAYGALPNVYIIGTGGTITGLAKQQTSAKYKDSAKTSSAIIKTILELKKLANIKSISPINRVSPDINTKDWLLLAKIVNKLLHKNSVDGIVILHGTDTLEETAYFLNLVVKSNKPVVITGAMRASNSLSADGPLNIYNAVAVAATPASKSKGVLVVMNDHIFDARNVTKTNTTNVATFKSPNIGAIGRVHYGNVSFFCNNLNNLHTTNSIFTINNLTSFPEVAIIYEYLPNHALFLRTAIKHKMAGIVFAGSGNGSIGSKERKLLALARKQGMVIVRSSRTGSGKVTYDSLFNLDSKLGLIAANDLNPQKARILLMLALTKTHDVKIIQKYFNDY